VLINGTDSTALARPLYPISLATANSVWFVSNTGYQVQVTETSQVVSGGVVSFTANDCTSGTPASNRAWKSNDLLRGTVFGLGTTTSNPPVAALYYMPKVPTTISNPTRGSSMSGLNLSPPASVCVVATTAQTGTFYEVLPNDPAITGVSISPTGQVIEVGYVP